MTKITMVDEQGNVVGNYDVEIVLRAPVADEPVEEPVAEDPVEEEPTTDPVEEEPVNEEPADEPVDEEPIDEEEPVVEEPVDEEPAEETTLEGAPATIKRVMNPTNCVNPAWYWNSRNGRYERFQRLIVWRGNTVTVEFQVQDLTSGGGIVAWKADHYDVTVDGNVVGSFSGVQGVTKTQFVSIDTSAFVDGWHVLDVNVPSGEMSVPFPVYVLKGSTLPVQEWMPSLTISYHSSTQAFCRLVWVPAVFQPNKVPVAEREYTHFSTVKSSDDLWFEQLLPTSGYNRRTSKSKDGILNTFNAMWYAWSGVIREFPRNPCLDGPRGIGALGSINHIDIGVATETIEADSAPRSNSYILDSWRVCRVSKTGYVKTLAGYRHKDIATYWEDPADLELVGDWSAVPADRRGFHELWGMAWDTRTLEVDSDAEPIEGRHPHVTAPAMFVADTQKNRICRLEFQPDVEDQPAKVTEFLTDLLDPWDVVFWKGSIIVSERLSHKVVQYDATTGVLQRVILEGADLATVDFNRKVQRSASLDVIRAEDIVAPEGLYIMDDWLYIGSVAMNQIRRVHLETGALEVVLSGVSQKMRFIKLAVSDGTFFPRHTIFYTDWSVTRRGYPYVYTPDGTARNITGNPRGTLPRGRNQNKAGIGYSGGVAVRNGRLMCGAVSEGVMDISLAKTDDPIFDSSLYAAGRQMYKDMDLDLLYGPNGYGYYGLALPWGISEEVDYYLEVSGHPKPEVS